MTRIGAPRSGDRTAAGRTTAVRPRAVDREVLRMLVVGETRPAIAGRTHLSPRAVDIRIAAIKRALGTSDRFRLGVRAVSAKLVDPDLPVAAAQERRPSASWAAPTARQVEILHARATGTVRDAAHRTGLSASTVRQELSGLARANGACGITHAGAVFSALGWIPPAAASSRAGGYVPPGAVSSHRSD